MATLRVPDGSETLRKFDTTLDLLTVQGPGERRYIRVELLKKWWESEAIPGASRRTRHIDVLLDHTYRKIMQPALPIHAEDICRENDGCIIVFSILLKVGGAKAGRCIDRYENHRIFDKFLPVSLLSLKEQGLPYAEEFNQAQWAFSPPKFDLYASRLYTERYIIPICKDEPINPGKGGTANLWQIGVQEEFVSPKLREKVKTCRFRDDKFGWCYQFALKKYNEGHARLFKNEKEAFRALRGKEGMIQYLGDYEHKETTKLPDGGTLSIATHNIILEYAELDLDVYFQEIRPPILEGEVAHFWDDMFDVAEAVNTIHDITITRGGVQHEYYGWHADIKPDNILIVQGKFKLADPGFARFEKKSDKDLATIAGGTETYSAPECYRAAKNASGTMSQVQRTIDIWSLGCVFSIAATWVVLGYDGIRQFRTFRDSAVQRTMKEQASAQPPAANAVDLTRGDYFHDGNDVLHDVREWHNFLRRFLRQGDTITSHVLDLVDKSMLIGDPNKRMQAKDLCVSLRRLLTDYRNQQRQPLLGSIMQALLEVDQAAPPRPEPSQALLTPVAKNRRTGKPSQIEPPKKTTHRSEYLRSELNAQGVLPELEPVTGGSAAGLDQSLKNNQALHYPRNQGHPRSEMGHETRESVDSLPGLHYESRKPTTFSMYPIRTAFPPPAHNSGRKPQNVFQARDELDKRKSVWSRKLGKDNFLTKFFDNRDIVFLLDNAETMDDEWPEASFLLETLAMKLEGQDKNGMDLHFTRGQSCLRDCKKHSKFKDKMNEEQARPMKGVHTDLSESLGKILQRYLDDLKRGMAIMTGIRNIKKLTLIVLTDGKWEGMGDREEIFRLIADFGKDMQTITKGKLLTMEDKLEKRRVTIEFVQFGNDADATARLRRLDNDLPYQGVEDIIDTEPSYGDVNKMILGSFVEEFDMRDNALSPPATPKRGNSYNTSQSQPPFIFTGDMGRGTGPPGMVPRSDTMQRMPGPQIPPTESTPRSRMISPNVPELHFTGHH